MRKENANLDSRKDELPKTAYSNNSVVRPVPKLKVFEKILRDTLIIFIFFLSNSICLCNFPDRFLGFVKEFYN